jgi:hypothetical protein
LCEDAVLRFENPRRVRWGEAYHRMAMEINVPSMIKLLDISSNEPSCLLFSRKVLIGLLSVWNLSERHGT